MSRAQHIIEKMLAAHIDAPPGAGKTTLQHKLEKEFPEFIFVDADMFRERAQKELAKQWRESTSSRGWDQKDFESMTRKKYELWRRQQKKPIVVFGWGEGFQFKVEDPSGKIHMNVNSIKTARQYIKRDGEWSAPAHLDSRRPWQEKLNKILKIIQVATRTMVDKQEIKAQGGYKKVRPGKIKKRLKQISGRMSSEQSK